jgi:hypothetical protein
MSATGGISCDKGLIMQKLAVMALMTGAVLVTSASLTRAAEPQEKSAQANQAQADATTKDPNYRRFNGQWWYWMPQSKSWKVWDGQKWNDFQSGQRSFSYQEPATAGEVQNYYNGSYSSDPYLRNRIIGSWGFRGAGLKAKGQY